jgi:divalent metal cation (Fe/Co/Zn/Cd) transporter
MYAGPEDIWLLMDVQFKTTLKLPEIHDAIDRILKAIQKEYQKVKYMIIQPDIKIETTDITF